MRVEDARGALQRARDALRQTSERHEAGEASEDDVAAARDVVALALRAFRDAAVGPALRVFLAMADQRGITVDEQTRTMYRTGMPADEGLDHEQLDRAVAAVDEQRGHIDVEIGDDVLRVRHIRGPLLRTTPRPALAAVVATVPDMWPKLVEIAGSGPGSRLRGVFDAVAAMAGGPPSLAGVPWVTPAGALFVFEVNPQPAAERPAPRARNPRPKAEPVPGIGVAVVDALRLVASAGGEPLRWGPGGRWRAGDAPGTVGTVVVRSMVDAGLLDPVGEPAPALNDTTWVISKLGRRALREAEAPS